MHDVFVGEVLRVIVIECIGNLIIQQVSGKKVLGVITDVQLKWNKPNDALCKKISQYIAVLRRAKQFVNQDALLAMLNELVLPYLAFSSSVWSDGSCTQAALVITGSTYEMRSIEILEKLG